MLDKIQLYGLSDEVLGLLGKGWEIDSQSEANLTSKRNLLQNQYAASGFVHYGKHLLNAPLVFNINEGLYTDLTKPNSLYLGGGDVGESKTVFALKSYCRVHV